MKKAFEELKKFLQRKIDDQQNVLRFVGISNINERQRYVLKTISENKRTLFTPKELATQFDISARSARTDLQELVEMGYLSITNQLIFNLRNLNKHNSSYHQEKQIKNLIIIRNCYVNKVKKRTIGSCFSVKITMKSSFFDSFCHFFGIFFSHFKIFV